MGSGLPDSSFYVMKARTDGFRVRILGKSMRAEGGDLWKLGHRLQVTPTVPLVYEFDGVTTAALPPLLDDVCPPLMSEKLLEVLARSGVDNLEAFDAILSDPKTGQTHRSHKAVNIVGLVSAMDPVASEYQSPSQREEPLIDLCFRNLILDEPALEGQRLFRMAENIAAVFVHRKVRDSIRRAIVDADEYLEFIHPALFLG